jgi:Zn-dependent protease with chaperone function
MSTPALIQTINDSGIAEWMRSSIKAMPIIEATHVLAVALVFGTILIVDLRLLGYPNARRPYTVVARELIWLTWSGFALAVITGAFMFAPNAVTYFSNTAFRLKMLALLAAGINMLIFQFLTSRSISQWDTSRSPTSARLAAVLSLTLWLTVIGLGRWIGFSKGYDFSVPDDVQFEFPQ